MDNKNLKKKEQDEWIWKEEELTIFSVKSAYKILKDEVVGEDKALYEIFGKLRFYR